MINEKWYGSISDRNLRTCFDEIMDFYATGVLPHKSLTRQLFRKFIEENTQLKSLESNPEQPCKYILEEMAKRYRYIKVKIGG